MERNDALMIARAVVLLACLAHPRATAMQLHRYWYLHPVLRDYDDPGYAQIQQWVREVRS